MDDEVTTKDPQTRAERLGILKIAQDLQFVGDPNRPRGPLEIMLQQHYAAQRSKKAAKLDRVSHQAAMLGGHNGEGSDVVQGTPALFINLMPKRAFRKAKQPAWRIALSFIQRLLGLGKTIMSGEEEAEFDRKQNLNQTRVFRSGKPDDLIAREDLENALNDLRKSEERRRKKLVLVSLAAAVVFSLVIVMQYRTNNGLTDQLESAARVANLAQEDARKVRSEIAELQSHLSQEDVERDIGHHINWAYNSHRPRGWQAKDPPPRFAKKALVNITRFGVFRYSEGFKDGEDAANAAFLKEAQQLAAKNKARAAEAAQVAPKKKRYRRVKDEPKKRYRRVP